MEYAPALLVGNRITDNEIDKYPREEGQQKLGKNTRKTEELRDYRDKKIFFEVSEPES